MNTIQMDMLKDGEMIFAEWKGGQRKKCVS